MRLNTEVSLNLRRIGVRGSFSAVGSIFSVVIAKLAFDLTLTTEASGANVLSLSDREATWICRLFQRAVGGFYDVVLSPQGWRVLSGGTMSWQVAQKTDGVDKILPAMRTDVVSDHPSTGRRIVIDTKFTSILTSGWYRDETRRNHYARQIYAYLCSQVGCGDALADCASGWMLHPAIEQMVDESVLIQGQFIRFATVDLVSMSTDM